MSNDFADFKKQNLDPINERAESIRQIGGLPEIWRAAADLRTALDKTHEEIALAVIADRFPRTIGESMSVYLEGVAVSSEMSKAIADEGEAGHKRESLRGDVVRLETTLLSLIGQLVEIRCEIIMSQVN